MFNDGKWKIELKRNGRIVKLAFNNMILNQAVNFNFDYSVNNATDSIITHMFVGSVHSDIKADAVSMGNGAEPIAALPYVDYIKPNYDNAAANVYEHQLVFKYQPTETVTIRQLGTGRAGATNKYFSIANVVDENGNRAELTVKPGDVLTFTYVLTIIGDFIEFVSTFNSAISSKPDLNNVLKANPNWALAGLKRQLEALAPVVSEHLGRTVTPEFEWVIDYGRVSGVTGNPYINYMYNIKWRLAAGQSFTGVDGLKFSKEFYPCLAFPFTRTKSGLDANPVPTGDVWSYQYYFNIGNGLTAVERFDHTKQAPIKKPKTPDSYSFKLIDGDYYFTANSDIYANWEINIIGADPLAQVLVIQNNKLVLPNKPALSFVGKDGKFKEKYKITNLKMNQPFYIHFYNRAGLTKYGPLFVNSSQKTLRAVVEQPIVTKGQPLANFRYPEEYNSYYAKQSLYIRPFGRITNDIGGKYIYVWVVEDSAVPDDPSKYIELSNENANRVNYLYRVDMPNDDQLITWLNKPNARVRIKLNRADVEFYEMPIVLKEVEPSVTTSYYSYLTSAGRRAAEAVTVDFKFKKL